MLMVTNLRNSLPEYFLVCLFLLRIYNLHSKGRGEHFLPHKFIKRTFKRRVNSTKQLLNAGKGHQAPRKEIGRAHV